MRSCFVTAKLVKTRLRAARLAIAALAALIVAGDHAGAASGRSERVVESIESRTAGEPIMAIVSLRSQRITVYDADGWILRAPVSSGQKGRETPAGIFSVLQKNAEHYSNLYDDAYMPHMQRLTWSGIALHGGVAAGISGVPWLRPDALRLRRAPVRRDPDGHAGDRGAGRRGARRDRPPGPVPAEAGRRRPGRRPRRRGGRGGQKGGSGEARRRDGLAGGRAGDDAGARGGKSEAQSRSAIGGRRDRARLRNLGRGKGSRPRKPRQRRSPGSPSCRRNGPPPRPSCNRSSMPSRPRVKPPSRPRPRGVAAAQAAQRGGARARAGIGVHQPQDAAPLCPARLSAHLGEPGHDPGTPIVRSARMSSPPWSGPTATRACDGASSHWTTDVRAAAAEPRMAALRGGPGQADEAGRRRARAARRPRSTGSSFRRTHWIASPAWCRRDRP